MIVQCNNKKILNFSKSDFKSLLAAIVISSLIIKLFTLVNPIVDVFFQSLLFISCLPKIKYIRKVRRNNLIFAVTFIYVVAITYISSLYSISNELILILAKSLFVFLTCISAMTFSEDEIKRTLDYFIIINVLYAVLLLAKKVPLNESYNYLNYTLPLGAACSILLSRIIYRKTRGADVLMLCVCIVALTGFAARGPFIFLVFITLVGCIFNRQRTKGLIILLAAGAALACFLFVLPHDSSFSLATRLLSILDSHSLEIDSREVVYSHYVDAIKASWFSGYGIGASTALIGVYPHNYLLQIWGELGLLAFVGVVLCNIVLYCRFFISALRNEISFLQIELFFVVSYYEFQFFKSFDLLSSYSLWVLFVFLLKSFSKTNNVVSSCYLPVQVKQ